MSLPWLISPEIEIRKISGHEKGPSSAGSFIYSSLKRNYQALFTSPERRHLEQTCIVLGVTPSRTLTLRILGFLLAKALLETCERVILIFLPNIIPLSHISHLAILTPPESVSRINALRNDTIKFKTMQAGKITNAYKYSPA